MSVAVYADVHVPFAVASGLRLRGVDILTAQDDGTIHLADPDLLDRATALNRILLTQDKDFLAEAAARQRTGLAFAGIVYAPQVRLTIGKIVQDVELIAKVFDPPDVANAVIYLPR